MNMNVRRITGATPRSFGWLGFGWRKILWGSVSDDQIMFLSRSHIFINNQTCASFALRAKSFRRRYNHRVYGYMDFYAY